ncbi:MAG: AraC family transcriptional regulator [Clostridia bacterium]|nr:AraC family transcriptional regulator [Clostridia bacterium]
MEILFQDVERDLQIDYMCNTRGGHMPLIHSHSAYEIYISESGERTYIIDDTIIELSAHDVAFIKPHELHTTDGSAYSRHLLYFKETYLNRFFTTEAKMQLLTLFQQKKLSLTADEHTELLKLLRTLSAKPDDFLVFCRIMQLFLHARANIPTDTVRRKSNLFSAIMEYVANHYLEIESLDTLAAQFYITKSHLCRLFKKETSVTIVTYINTQKLQLAREQLKLSKKSIAQIASECNFNSSMYFCKLFKETLGLTPTEYRKQMQN